MTGSPRWSTRCLTVLAVALATLLGGVPSAGAEENPSSAAVWPGPAILNSPAPRAPQLENTGIWRADPTRICMSSAYRAGEFLYQGCLWDDHGAGLDYEWPANSLLRNYTYPTDPAYRSNAADLVELRTRPLRDATAFRITYNTMTDPELAATTLALGDSHKPLPAPHGANTVMPAQVFVTVHGTTADVVNAADGKDLGTAPVTVDPERRQVEVRVPHSAFDPTGRRDVRLAAATGLWDKGNGRYLVPQATADAQHPGGAPAGTEHPSAFFDVAFRYDEPMDSAWRDRLQKAALLEGDISRFHAEVDFTKLAGGVDDDMADQRGGVPTHGYIQRIFPSHFELAQGRRQPGDPGAPPTGTFTQQGGLNTGNSSEVSAEFGWVCREDCVPDLAGRLQRYLIYVPETAAPAKGYASLTWLPGYGLTPNDQVRENKDLFRSVGDRADAPTAVIAVDGRGSDNWYYGQSGASVFETLSDAARFYKLDPTRRAISGFSMGGYGANKLALQFPEVFSKAFVCDGLDRAPSFPAVNGVADTLPLDTVTQHEPGSKLTPLLPSRRNQPVMEWAGANDDFIPYNITRERADAYAAGAYDYEFISWAGPAGEHVIQCNSGLWDVFTRWLGDGSGFSAPAHVTYVRNPKMDDARFDLVGDRAYWLSGISTRSTDGSLGTIDVFSKGFGVGDPTVPAQKMTVGTTSGTTSPVNPYLREYRHLPAPPTAPKANELDIDATNISAVTIDPKRAKVDCGAKLHVVSDGPVRITLTGCGAPRTFGAGTTTSDPVEVPLPVLP